MVKFSEVFINTKIKLFLENKTIINIGIFLSVFLLFFTALYINKDMINVLVISHNQILTATEWLNGNFFWLGPEVPFEKQYLPGPLMYFLLMPPLIMSKTPYASSIVWLIAWMSMTFSVAFSFVKTICKDSLSPLFFLLLVFTSSFLFHELLFFQWNVMFSLLFHLLILISFYKWKEKKEDAYLCLLGVVMGLGVQIHYSILFHLVTLAGLLITDEKLQNSLGLFDSVNPKGNLEYKPFQWKYLSGFVMLFLLPQTPYLAILVNEEVYMPKPDMHRILWLIQDFFSNPLQDLKKLIFFLDLNLKRLLSLLPICIAVYMYKLFKKEKIYIDESLITLALILITPVLIGFVFSNSLFFIGLFTLVLFVKWHDGLWPRKNLIKYVFFILYGLSLSVGLYTKNSFVSEIFLSSQLIIFVLLCILFAVIYFYEKKQRIFLKLSVLTIILIPVFYVTVVQRGDKGTTYQLKEVVKLIYRQTGWRAETAVNRIFILESMPKRSFSFSYLLAMEEEKQAGRNNFLKEDKQKNYGYFLIKKKALKNLQKNHSHDKIEDYLLSEDVQLPAEVKKEVFNGHLKIQTAQNKYNYLLFPYTIKKTSVFPEGFHNVPVIYKDPDWFQEVCYFSGLFKKDNTFYLCYLFDGYFETLAVAIRFFQKNSQTFINVEITGPPLTVIKVDRVIPHHFIKNMKLELFCDKKETVNLLSHIGLNDNVKSKFHKSLFAPVRVRKPVSCDAEKMKKISIHFEHQREWGELKQQSYSFEL